MARVHRYLGPLVLICFVGALLTTTGVAGAADPPVVQPGVGKVFEGSSPTGSILRVPVTLSAPSTQTVTVQWNTYFYEGMPPSQATPSTDYTPASGTVTFAPGQTAKGVSINVTGDALDEVDEFVLVKFHDATNATVTNTFYGLGVGYIRNDDVSVVPGSASVVEGADSTTSDLVVPVSLSAESGHTVSVQWNTFFYSGPASRQATPSTDYALTSGIVTFSPGDTAETLTISVNGDAFNETDEFVLVQFHDPTNAKVGAYGFGAAYIQNDDFVTTTACPAGEQCESPTTTSSDGSTNMTVTAAASAGPQTVTVQVGGVDPMQCTLPESGSVVAEYHTTAPDASKVADYTVFGDAAVFAQNFYASHTDISGCYGSPDQFNGWSPCFDCEGTWADGPYEYGPAPFDEGTGLYEAFLGSCANHGGYQPCFTNINGGSYNTTEIHSPASANDPRASH